MISCFIKIRLLLVKKYNDEIIDLIMLFTTDFLISKLPSSNTLCTRQKSILISSSKKLYSVHRFISLEYNIKFT